MINESTYPISGEVDYTSQQNKIGGEYEHIGEVLREVGVSNPYDAESQNIDLYPLYIGEASCLMVLDDGHGMDTTACTKEQQRGCNGHAKSSLSAYFHIGHSTKPRGKVIGQFCMGSNLALAQADVMFALVTRTKEVPAGMYWVIVQVSMSKAFTDPSKFIESRLMTKSDAQQLVMNTLQLQSDNMYTAWAEWIEHAFFALNAEQGTLQMFVSKDTDLHKKRFMDVHQRAWPVPGEVRSKHTRVSMIEKDIHATPFYTYLRFFTRHGSLLQFPTIKCQMRAQTWGDMYTRDMRRAKMTIFCDAAKTGEIVPYGFPYIYADVKIAPDSNPEGIKQGSNIKAQTSYWARLGPVEFTRNTNSGKVAVAVFAAMDSYNVRMAQYEGLDRSGKTRCGIGMCRTQGIVLSVHGTYVTTIRGDALGKLLDALPTDPSVQDHMEQSTKDGLKVWNEKYKMHNLTIVIDSIFEMKTDRNNITPAEMQRLLTDVQFLQGLSMALQEFRNGRSTHSKNFNDMLDYMVKTKKGEDESNTIAYCQHRAHTALECGSFRIIPKETLPLELAMAIDPVSETYAMPGPGHESSLVHLYGLYGASARAIARSLVRHPHILGSLEERRFKELVCFWGRLGLLFNGQGVDAQIFEWHVSNDEARFGTGIEAAASHMKQYEFKIELEATFNHPFLQCDAIIVCGLHDALVTVCDSCNNTAEVIRPSEGDPLYGIGCYLDNIVSSTKAAIKSRLDRACNLKIPVIFFPSLVRATFEPFADIDYRAPQKIFHSTKVAKNQKRKRTAS